MKASSICRAKQTQSLACPAGVSPAYFLKIVSASFQNIRISTYTLETEADNFFCCLIRSLFNYFP